MKFLAKVWKWTDGWKTVGGLVIAAGGVALFWTPAAPVAKEVVTFGLTVAGVGLLHKAAKREEAKNGKRDS